MAARPMLLVLVVQLLFICGQAMVISDTDMEADKIGRLPGQPAVGFDHYSGYITIHHAHDHHLAFQFDDDRDRDRGRSSGTSALFYYLAEAQTDALSKPLVLWLNGGPGCSSVGVGAFSENGPFRPGPHHELLLNPFAWNSEANMLYLETPVGVGFSYSTDPASYQAVTDHSTAWDNLVFLQKWFLKFPQYKNRSLFITGESYAGHYIPQLAELMLQFNKKENLFNLKGIALGNPVLEFATDFNSRAEYFWSHGLISDATYKVFTTACNYSQYVGEYLRGNVSPMCSKVMSLVSRETSRFVDKYDVTLDVCLPSVFSQSNILNYRQPQQVGETIDVCVEDETLRYLNRRDVQKSLHARLVGTNSWTVCSKILEYDLLDLETPTIHIVGNLIKEGIPVLIYSGDQDSVIPLTGSRTLVNQLAHQLGLHATVPYRVWFAGKQVGGWTQVHGDILSFATIRGASHEAPFSQPERSLVLFKSFLEGMPLPELF